MELIARLKSDEKTRNAYTVAAAFVALYCWYTAFWDNINLEAHIVSLGLRFNDVLAVFQIACVTAVFFGFFFIKGEYLSSPRPVWIALHILAFFLMQLVALSPIKELLTVSAAAGGLCVGFVGYRLFYGMFFYISKPNPVKAVAIAYIFIRTYIYTYAIVPVDRLPALFFAVQAATLLISLILGLMFRGNDMEIRYSLRENDLQLRDTWPTLVYVAAFQICLSLYQGIIVPRMPRSFWLNSYQILPSVVTLFCMLRFSRFFTITNTVRLFIIMTACGFISFLALESGSRLLVDTFIQPAYLFANTFYIWLIYSIFFTYGNKYLKLRLFLCLNAAVHYLSLILVKALAPWLTTHPKAAVAALPFIFGLFLLIPAVDSFVKKLNTQREYIESQKEKEILLPPDHPAVIGIRGKFLSTLPPDVLFTQQEQEVLSYLIADHDEEMLAYYMGIRRHEAKNAVKSILSKCGAVTKAALIMHIGQLCGPVEQAADINAILAGYNLTAREITVCTLLLGGYSRKQIGVKLQISYATVGFHCTSLYKKLNINSLSELFALFGYKEIQAE
jgi:DNA-binding CsgD family transcriptional regulator